MPDRAVTWRPLSREQLDAMIADALARYDDQVRSDWEDIRIPPEKWSCPPEGDEGGGFWAVAVRGDQVLWFNDIEDGFNWSQFTTRGVIGRYWCNQTEFESILELFAQQHNRAAWKTVTTTQVPADLVRPGRIGQRQTTYWDLNPERGGAWRVHFKNKYEFSFASSDYDDVEILRDHPLLFDYHEPTYDLFVFGTPINPKALSRAVDDAIRAHTDGWRDLAHYANVEPAPILGGGHGLLMRAPESVCRVASRVLTDAGVRATTPGRGASVFEAKLLLLGQSYVVANELGFTSR